MRTKAIILSAALVAAGVATSMAQSNVYSLNVVGYVNLTVSNGYSLLTLPLQSADATSSINSVLTNTSVVTPFGSTVISWNSHTSSFNAPYYAGGDGSWYDAGFNLLTNGLPVGSAFFLYLAPTSVQAANGDPTPYVTSETITVVGTVLQGTNSIAETAGYNFYGNFEPVSGDITTNGFPVTASFGQLFTWNLATQKYNNPLYSQTAADSGGPYPTFVDAGFNTVVVAPAVGAGFLYYNVGSAATWTQTFTVQ